MPWDKDPLLIPKQTEDQFSFLKSNQIQVTISFRRQSMPKTSQIRGGKTSFFTHMRQIATDMLMRTLFENKVEEFDV